MMQALILLHRWLGVAFCLLFAMWFASGIVMHFVPFPTLTEADRFAGLAPIDLARVGHASAEAVAASGIGKVTRVRLRQRSDGPVYLVSDLSRAAALHAADLSDAAVHSRSLALDMAADYARRRHLDAAHAMAADMVRYDQWTVESEFDPYRPLYRVALNDSQGTELYVSSATGEIVLETTRSERMWNYAGSVAHWIYPAALRSHQTAWQRLLWWLSLAALIGATAGALAGTLRIWIEDLRLVSPYRGWQKLHHWLGLACMLFVLSWIFSGWLSMDDGRLFSSGRPTGAEAAAISGTPVWFDVPHDEIRRVSPAAKEIEWFAFGGRLYRRERSGVDRQLLFLVGTSPDAGVPDRAFLQPAEIDAAASRLGHDCKAAAAVTAADAYGVVPMQRDAPIYRSVCGDVWFDFDGANGALLEKVDASRRAYRWLFGALHNLDFPALTARPALRTALITGLCACGFVFSLTGIVIACRRLMSFSSRRT
jgi:PepSY-associated TM region